MPEPSDYSAAFAERLRSYGVEAKLIGALAALRYRATPRLTVDVDFLARDIGGLASKLRSDGFDVEEFTDDAGAPYLLYVRGDGVRVDVLVAETDYQRLALDRADDVAISVEDVLVHKLIAGRARDVDDIREILRTGRGFDRAYVDEWAQAWGRTELWQELLADA